MMVDGTVPVTALDSGRRRKVLGGLNVAATGSRPMVNLRRSIRQSYPSAVPGLVEWLAEWCPRTASLS